MSKVCSVCGKGPAFGNNRSHSMVATKRRFDPNLQRVRILVDGEFKPASGILGAGVEQLNWPRPVRPGDELRVESEVLEKRPSKSRPDQGVVKVRVTTLNQNNEPVQVFIANLIVLRRAT